MKYSKLYLIKQAYKNRKEIRKIPSRFRMIGLWIKGEYKPKTLNILLPLLGIIYIISPIDLIPEFIPFFGVTDDIAILSLCLSKLMKEINRFHIWSLKTNNTLN